MVSLKSFVRSRRNFLKYRNILVNRSPTLLKCSFTGRFKHKIVNKTTCIMPSANPLHLAKYFRSMRNSPNFIFQFICGRNVNKIFLRRYKGFFLLILSLEIFRILNTIAAKFSFFLCTSLNRANIISYL